MSFFSYLFLFLFVILIHFPYPFWLFPFLYSCFLYPSAIFPSPFTYSLAPIFIHSIHLSSSLLFLLSTCTKPPVKPQPSIYFSSLHSYNLSFPPSHSSFNIPNHSFLSTIYPFPILTLALHSVLFLSHHQHSFYSIISSSSSISFYSSISFNPSFPSSISS